MAGGFNLDQIVNDPSFITGMGLLGAGSGRPNAMAAFNVLDTNRKFAEAQKLNAAKIEQEKAQTGMMGQQANLYGQEVEQRRAQTQLLQQQLQRQQAQWEMGMKFLQQIRPDLAGAVQPPVQVQPAPNAPPVTVPGPPNIPAAQQAASVGKHGTPNLILDNLMQVESGGNQFAIGPVINDGTGERALGPYQFRPSTINMLRKEGYTFNPFDKNQARDAADYLLQKNLQANGGDWNKAIAAYGGFKSKDPTAYIQKVTAGFSGSPEAQAAASVQQSATQAELARLSAQAAAAR
ncbi:MAG TPA: transglycosylase SLT domain-containing protein, partial [Nitrospira sp.]